MDASMTMTSMASSPTSTAAASMGGMDMGGGCKISMLWNWYTINSCFIASTWRVTSKGAFAGSCIGVILLVMALEFLRRSGKEYDRYLIRTHTANFLADGVPAAGTSSDSDHDHKGLTGGTPTPSSAVPSFRPTILQQAIRALLHMIQFAVAYFIMLLAMYYNGYIIISIFIGAYLGAFVFHWEKMGGSVGQTSAGENTTVCCG